MPGPYDAIISEATQRYKLPEWLLPALMGQESGGNVQATSPKGAQGLLQLMPDTARGLGVTDPYDPGQNIDAGARYLRQQLDEFGTVPLALAAYNAGPGAVKQYGGIPPYQETQNYVQTIMGREASAPAPPAVEPSAGAVSRPPTAAPPPNLGLDAGLLAALNQGNALLGLPKLNLPSLPAATVQAPAKTGAASPVAAMVAPANLRTTDVAKHAAELVRLAPTADRADVRVHPGVVNFIGDIAAINGGPLTISTGTNHNQFVKNTHRESAHWTGWAADILAEGTALTKLGYSALLAAGMAPQKAQRAAKSGGAFNVNGYQIIFKSNVGGNHWNHLHVGLRPERQKA